jgi:DnaJ-domain-containing protein 1
MHADLRLFLYRCGVSIDQHGRSTKRLLQKSYRQAMLKFHPDRARQKSIREQALANEVTKWLTHAWQQLPP